MFPILRGIETIGILINIDPSIELNVDVLEHQLVKAIGSLVEIEEKFKISYANQWRNLSNSYAKYVNDSQRIIYAVLNLYKVCYHECVYSKFVTPELGLFATIGTTRKCVWVSENILDMYIFAKHAREHIPCNLPANTGESGNNAKREGTV